MYSVLSCLVVNKLQVGEEGRQIVLKKWLKVRVNDRKRKVPRSNENLLLHKESLSLGGTVDRSS